jgi:hypothetical protein
MKLWQLVAPQTLDAAKEQSARVRLQLNPTVDLVLVDRLQIQQVLLNSMRNALEAMQTPHRRELGVPTTPAADEPEVPFGGRMLTLSRPALAYGYNRSCVARKDRLGLVDGSDTGNMPRTFGEATGRFHLWRHGARIECEGARRGRRDMAEGPTGRHRPFGPRGRARMCPRE